MQVIPEIPILLLTHVILFVCSPRSVYALDLPFFCDISESLASTPQAKIYMLPGIYRQFFSFTSIQMGTDAHCATGPEVNVSPTISIFYISSEYISYQNPAVRI